MLRTSEKKTGFTLIEVIASLAILAVLLAGVMVIYQRTIDSVGRQIMRERAMAVAQRHMEVLLAHAQEPNVIGLPIRDEIDPLFTWQLDLKRIMVDSDSPSPGDFAKTFIQATVKVNQAEAEAGERSTVELIRYFATLKPIPGQPIAVPIAPELPPWYLELQEKLGREPTIQEALQCLIESGQLPPDALEEIGELEIDEENEGGNME
jgi:prepilin-type N-terminal cleavage/methylation domain-containing protein